MTVYVTVNVGAVVYTACEQVLRLILLLRLPLMLHTMQTLRQLPALCDVMCGILRSLMR